MHLRIVWLNHQWGFPGSPGQCFWEVPMKLLHSTALTAALMAIALPLLTSPADAWRGGGWRGAAVGWRGGGWRGGAVGWRGGGWGRRGAGVGLATAALRPIAKVMGPATATRLTGVTGTP